MDRDRKRESRISFIFFFIFDQEEEDEDNESKSRIRRSRTPFDVIYLWIYVLGPLSLDLKERFSSAHILNFCLHKRRQKLEKIANDPCCSYTQRWLLFVHPFWQGSLIILNRAGLFRRFLFSLSLDHIQQDPCIVVQCTIYIYIVIDGLYAGGLYKLPVLPVHNPILSSPFFFYFSFFYRFFPMYGQLSLERLKFVPQFYSHPSTIFFFFVSDFFLLFRDRDFVSSL